jgi:hypothetical protein
MTEKSAEQLAMSKTGRFPTVNRGSSSQSILLVEILEIPSM